MVVHWLIFLFVLLGVGVLFCGGAVLAVAWSLTHPPRMTDGRAMAILRRLSPADLGLPFEELSFSVRDTNGNRLNIASWWIPHPDADGRCAVLLHGYADAKVGVIAWAPVWYSLGFNLLIPDLRAHGESGGAVCTAGALEGSDVAQVLNDVRAQFPGDTKTIVLFGVSMGAAVAGRAAIESPDVAGVVMESPYADFRRAAMAHMDRLGAPGRVLQRAALALAERLTRTNFDDVAPIRLIPQLKCPVLVIESENDPFLTPQDRADLARAVSAAQSGELWTAEGVEHLLALSADPQLYRDKLASFLRSHRITGILANARSESRGGAASRV